MFKKKTLYLFASGDRRIIYVYMYVAPTHNNLPIYIYYIYTLYGDTTQDIWIVYATKRSGRFFAACYVERKAIFQNDKKIAWLVFFNWRCIVHIISEYVLSVAFIRCDSDQNVIYNETTSCTAIYYFLINYCKYDQLFVGMHVFFRHVHLLYHITRLFVLYKKIVED